MIAYSSNPYTLGFDGMITHMKRDLLSSDHVDTGHWQSLSGVPQTKTIEMQNVVVSYDIPETEAQLALETGIIDPGKTYDEAPWAELQFQERVAGLPVNPGDTYYLWPYFRGNVPTHQDEQEQFSHTYMERFWPRHANPEGLVADERPDLGHYGIRYRYGDLNDVLDLLAREPYTRQAYLPIFFPEDTGAHHGERIPCTLGYHFLLRDSRLHITYFIRSCDFYRHFRDDVYMAARLAQWVIEEMQERADDSPTGVWLGIKPGTLTMHMTSLHVFEGDEPRMLRELAIKKPEPFVDQSILVEDNEFGGAA